MKYQIMLRILFLLLSRDKVSAKYIADKYELSLRTVYRYIDELSLANVPIYNVRGRNGGYAISDTYKIPANYLTDEESKKIISTLSEINKEIGSPVIETAVNKLSSISKKPQGDVHINFGNLVIDGSAWGNSDVYKETLKLFERAVEQKQIVQVSYRDREGLATVRNIEPHTLVLKQGLWYIYSYCRLRNTFRLFKIGRIEKAKLLSETFERKEVGDMSEVLSKWYEEEPKQIELIIDESVKADVEEWLGVDKVDVSSSGKITASCNLPINDYLTAKILSFKNKVKVVAPKSLINAVIEAAKEVENLYK